MPPETPTGETPVVTDPKNNATATTVPVTDKPIVDPAIEVERKRAEQAEMRANQLANQLKAKEEAEAAQKAKELEEQNQYKTLYEQERAKREQVESEREAAETAATLKAESDKLLSQYPDSVQKIAEATGLSLTATDDSAVATLKQKLDQINSQVKQPKVTANNPGHMQTATPELNNQQIHDMMKDPKKFDEYLRTKTKGIASMLKNNAE